MLVDPNPALGMFVLRLALGILFLAHGPQKLTPSDETAAGMGMSKQMIMLVGLLETVGAASMILGIRTDIGAVLLGVVMIGAIYTKTQKWGKKFTGENGWELDFIILAGLIAVLLSSPSGYGLF